MPVETATISFLPPSLSQTFGRARVRSRRLMDIRAERLKGEDGHKALVRRIYDEIINQGNAALASEVVAADFVDHVPSLLPGQPTTGPAALTWVVSSFRTAFPDLHASIEDVVVARDRVWVRSLWSGTHQGEFLGIVPTRRRITVQVIEMARVADGMIAEHWAEMDFLGLLQQLDLMPQTMGTIG